MANFPNNLSILRRKAGYTQESLAEALGVSRQAVSKWESGQTLPEAATLLALAAFFVCLAVSVFLLISGGMAHDEF